MQNLHSSKLWITTMVLTGLIILFSSSSSAQGSPRHVTVTITKIIQIGDGVDPGPFSSAVGEFYAKVTINGHTQDNEDDHTDDPFDCGFGCTILGDIFPFTAATPFWVFTRDVPANLTTVEVDIEIWDFDPTIIDADDNLDASPDGEDVDLIVDLTTGRWSGDTTQTCSEGTGGEAVSVCFDISTISSSGDADGDGLLDGWEKFGFDEEGDGNIDVDLPTFGANPLHKDIFLELDYLVGEEPRREDIQAMKVAFANAPIDAGTKASSLPGGYGLDAKPNPDGKHGINLWVDTGGLVDQTAREGDPLHTCQDGKDNGGRDGFDSADIDCIPALGIDYIETSVEDAGVPNCMDGGDNDGDTLIDGNDPDCLVGDNLRGGNTITTPVTIGCLDDPNRGFYTAKRDRNNFNPNRKWIFRYGISGNGVNNNLSSDPNGCGGGQAEGSPDGGPGFGGNDFIEFVHDGGTIMHELGHTLGLRHGGFDNDNCKPNYVSVMNYDNQNGIVQNGGGIILDYSPPRFPNGRGVVLPKLEEDNLNEATTLDASDTFNNFVYVDGLGNKVTSRLDSPVNWDGVGGINGTVPPVNIDTSAGMPPIPLGCTNTLTNSLLTGYDDWSHISLPFRQFGESLDGAIHPTKDPEPTLEELLQLQEMLNTTDLTLTKTGLPNPVLAGEQLEYTLTITNNGPNPASATTITDVLPPSVVYQSDNMGCFEGPVDTLTCGLGELLAQESREIKLTVEVDPLADATPIINRATAENLAGPDPDPTNDIAEVTTQVIPRGIIRVNACPDQDADGNCAPGDSLPDGVQGCLRGNLSGDLGCKPVEAVFRGLDPDDTFTPYLKFTDASQGHYQTTRAVGIQVKHGEDKPAILGAVYPVHPTGISVHQPSNKVYAAFQGAKIGNDWPYPFIAVIDSTTDVVSYTIGGPNGIGRQPWGVAVSGDNVYVGSYGEGRVDVINANTDVVMANVTPNRADFRPAAPAVNPANGQVHFPDTRGRRLVILNGTSIVADRPLNFLTDSFRPLEVAVSPTGSQGYTYMSMRLSNGAQTVGIAEAGDVEAQAALPGVTSLLPPPLSFNSSYATALWPQSGPPEPRLFVTYADNSRPGNPYPNPNRLVIYSFNPGNPSNLLQRQANIPIGDYAEAGLIFDPTLNRMLGTYGGFAYDQTQSDAGACSNPARGGIYGVDGGGNVVNGIMPALVVGNPPLITSTLQWRNPFELALNPNNGKVYVTDRCWNEFPAPGGGLTGGAVLAFNHSAVPAGGPLPPPIVSPAEAPVTVVPIEPTVTTTPIPTDLPEPTVTPEPTSTPVMVVPVEPTLEPEPITAPTGEPAPDGTVLLSGQVTLASSQGEASVTLEDTGQSVTTDAAGFFSLSGITEGPYNSITADAPGHLPAACAQPTVVGPETRLAAVTLLDGDLDDNNQVDIADLSLAVSSYGQTGPDLAADLNADGAG